MPAQGYQSPLLSRPPGCLPGCCGIAAAGRGLADFRLGLGPARRRRNRRRERWGHLGFIVAAGLLGHAFWDAYHHHVDRVVMRSMAEVCGVLDTLLAIVVIAVTLT